MDTDPQDPPRHAGQIVRRMLLRRNIAVDPETAQLVADAVQAVLHAVPPSRPPRRGPRVPDADCEPLFLYGADIRPRACSCLITGNQATSVRRRSRRWHPAMAGVVARERQLSGRPQAQGSRQKAAATFRIGMIMERG
jgi:hypothetical protein